MGMTMTQKILAAHAGLPSVSAGQLIEAELDLVLGNDITSPVAIHEMDKMKVDGVFDKDKVALVLDHFVPNKDIKSAEHCKCVREFACKHDIPIDFVLFSAVENDKIINIISLVNSDHHVKRSETSYASRSL
jgi:homoaconitase/3-isopropylmalate dehydratase large subunit